MYVSTTNASLDLSRGAVAQSLLKAGGAALQDECNTYYHTNGDVAEWDIGTTGGAGLKCKHVIHTVGGRYKGVASQQVSISCTDVCKYHIRINLFHLMFSVLFETHCRSLLVS